MSGWPANGGGTALVGYGRAVTGRILHGRAQSGCMAIGIAGHLAAGGTHPGAGGKGSFLGIKNTLEKIKKPVDTIALVL